MKVTLIKSDGTKKVQRRNATPEQAKGLLDTVEQDWREGIYASGEPITNPLNRAVKITRTETKLTILNDFDQTIHWEITND